MNSVAYPTNLNLSLANPEQTLSGLAVALADDPGSNRNVRSAFPSAQANPYINTGYNKNVNTLIKPYAYNGKQING